MSTKYLNFHSVRLLLNIYLSSLNSSNRKKMNDTLLDLCLIRTELLSYFFYVDSKFNSDKQQREERYRVSAIRAFFSYVCEWNERFNV